jgi:hypothetical protein
MAQTKVPTFLKYALILVLGAIILLFPISLPPGAGDGDFQAYWSSAYLFANGMDFSDSDLIGEVERSQTNWDKPETLYAWYSPIGNVVLLPFTLIPFPQAVYYWLILNIIVLFYSTLLVWGEADSRMWIPLLAVFSFSMTVISLVFGQINTLEVLGLALFLYFIRSDRQYLAGGSLVLTTIKPHLVLLTLPILLLDLFRKKEWKALTGFLLALSFCILVLFAFYPPWLQSLWTVVTSGMSTVRETPNINGLLVLTGEYSPGKLIWLIALPGAVVWWLKDGQNWNRRTFIDLSVTLGLILAPIGWSYDQVMLIFPVLTLLSWVVRGKLPRQSSKIIVTTLIAANLAAYLLRTFTPSDVWFIWVPLVVLGLYLYANRNRQRGAVTIPQLP